ncbi:hypothetical protein JCM9279_002383 [Rhodotorula babjevae]
MLLTTAALLSTLASCALAAPCPSTRAPLLGFSSPSPFLGLDDDAFAQPIGTVAFLPGFHACGTLLVLSVDRLALDDLALLPRNSTAAPDSLWERYAAAPSSTLVGDAVEGTVLAWARGWRTTCGKGPANKEVRVAHLTVDGVDDDTDRAAWARALDDHARPHLDSLPPAPHNSVVLVTSLSPSSLRTAFDLASPPPSSPSSPSSPSAPGHPNWDTTRPRRERQQHGLVVRTLGHMVDLALAGAFLVACAYAARWLWARAMSTAAAPTPAPHHPSPASLSISTSLAALLRLAPRLISPAPPTSSTSEPLLETFFCTLLAKYPAPLTHALVHTIALGSALKPLATRAEPGTVTRRGVEAVVEVLCALQEQQQGTSGGEAQREGERDVASWLEGFVEVVEREVEGGQGQQDSVDGAHLPAPHATKPSPARVASPAPRHSSKGRTLSRAAKPDHASAASLPSPRSASSPPLDPAHERTSRSATAAADKDDDELDGLGESPLPRAKQLAQQLAEEDDEAPTSSGGATAATAGRKPLRDKNGAVGRSAHQALDEAQPAKGKGKGKARARSPSRSRSSSPAGSPRRAAHPHPPKHSLSQLGALASEDEDEGGGPIELDDEALEPRAPAAASTSRSAKTKPKLKPASKPRTTSNKTHQGKKSRQGLLFRPETASSADEREHDELDPAPAPAPAPGPTKKKKSKPHARPRVKTPDDVEVDELASDPELEPDTDDGELDAPPAPAPKSEAKSKPKVPVRARPTVKRQQTSSAEEDEDEDEAPAAGRSSKRAASKGGDSASGKGKKRKVVRSYSSSEDEKAEPGPSRSRRRASSSPPPPTRSKPGRKGKAAAPRAASTDDDDDDATPSTSKGKGKKHAAVVVPSKRRAAPTVAKRTQPACASSSSAPPSKKRKSTPSTKHGAKDKGSKGKTRASTASRSKRKPKVDGSRSSARVAAAAAESSDDDEEDPFEVEQRVYSWHDGQLVWPAVVVKKLKDDQVAWAILPGTKRPAKPTVYIASLALARKKLALEPATALPSPSLTRELDAANAVYNDLQARKKWLRTAVKAIDDEMSRCGLEDEDEDEGDEEGSEGEEEGSGSGDESE